MVTRCKRSENKGIQEMVNQQNKFIYPECNDMFHEFEIIKKDNTKIKAIKFEEQVYMMIILKDIKVEEAYQIMCKYFKEHIMKAQALNDNILFLSYNKKPDISKPHRFEATLYIDTWAKTLTFPGFAWIQSDMHKLKDAVEWMLVPEITTRYSKLRSV